MSSVKFDIDTLGNLTPNDATGIIAITYTAAGSITGFLPKAQLGPLKIPGILGSVTVTSIGNSVFSGCTGLTSIVIPDSVTSIGSQAFTECTKLTSVTFTSGSQLLTIGNSAFYNCNKLASVTIPASVISIDNNAFNSCTGLTSINIPALVTSIGGSAFQGCTGLTSITIPASVTSIGNQAFLDCSKLTSISVDSNNQNFSSVNGVLYNLNATALICYPAGKLGSTFIIPDSVTTIGTFAFSRCTSLTSISIPASVTTIGTSAFFNCTSLMSITFGSGSQLLTIGDQAFNACNKLASFVIPDSVTTIGYAAFYVCTSLTSINIPASVTTISNSAFAYCAKLASIVIPASVTTIDTRAFDSCSNLTSITFASSSQLLTIGNGAFNNCRILTAFVIPASVTTIGDSVFSGCSKLATVTFWGNVPTLGSNAFANISSSANAYYISNTNNRNLAQYFKCLITYTTSGSITGFTPKTYAGPLIIPNIFGGVNVTSIGENAFNSCTGLTSITIPASVTNIYNGAFGYCNSLASISVDSSNANYSSVGGVLYNRGAGTIICYPIGKSGSTFTIPASVTTIDGNAFDSCTGLSSITIPASVTSIGENAFQGSGLITMYVYAQNQLDLTPGTQVTRYGKSFTVRNVAKPTIPICFLVGTKVTTDQGDIDIEKLNPKIHTILGKKIVSITKSAPLKKLFYKGKGVNAIDLVEGYQGAPETNSELLHIVLIKK